MPHLFRTLKHLDAKAITVDAVKDDGNSLTLPQTRFAFFDENGQGDPAPGSWRGYQTRAREQLQMQGNVDERLIPKGTDGNDVFYSRYAASTVEADLGRGDDLYSVKGTVARISDAGGRNFAEVDQGKSGSFIKFGSDTDKKTTAAKSFAHLLGGTTAYLRRRQKPRLEMPIPFTFRIPIKSRKSN